MNTKASAASEWLKKQVDSKFAKEMNYKKVTSWFSPDRPHADVVVECVDNNNEKTMFRFMVVT
jgi:hypothetical protein